MLWMIWADVQRQRQRSAFVRQLFDLGLLIASPIQCIFSPTVAAYLLCISWLSACEIPQTSPKHQTPVVTVNVLHAWWHYSHQCKDECKTMQRRMQRQCKENTIIMQYKYKTSQKHQLSSMFFTLDWHNSYLWGQKKAELTKCVSWVKWFYSLIFTPIHDYVQGLGFNSFKFKLFHHFSHFWTFPLSNYCPAE